jgi:hypothetical protein
MTRADRPTPATDFAQTGISWSLSALVLIVVLVTLGPLTAVAAQSHSKTQRARKATICGNPLVNCRLDRNAHFEPFDLPFRIPNRAVIDDTELFYAIILKSVAVSETDCDTFVPESERLAAQSLLPDHKVFSDRCTEPGQLFYTNTSEKHRFMAVYAGLTLADAKRFLAIVKATGKFPGANLRRMRTGINGT